MYVFMYVNPETIPEEEYFQQQKLFAENYNKMSN